MRTALNALLPGSVRTLLLLLILVVVISLPPSGHAADAGASSNQLSVMTFNLRYASDTSPHSWAERRPAMQACLEKTAPDIIGTQEGLYRQLNDLSADLPAYRWIGLGRDGGSHGEFMAVFYRPDRLEPQEFDHFWLSESPDRMASADWGNTSRRMVTWVRFLDRRTAREFYLFNTHLDNSSRPARLKSAALIRSRIQSIVTNNLPVLLIGDFNAIPGLDKTYDLFLEGDFFTDAWSTARTRVKEGVNTFHNYGGEREGPMRIDWILTRGPWECDHLEVVVFSLKGEFPSDHHPVMARLRLR